MENCRKEIGRGEKRVRKARKRGRPRPFRSSFLFSGTGQKGAAASPFLSQPTIKFLLTNAYAWQEREEAADRCFDGWPGRAYLVVR